MDIDVLQEPEIVSELLQGEFHLPQTDFTTTQAGAESSAIRTKQKIERNQDFSQFPWVIHLSLLKTNKNKEIVSDQDHNCCKINMQFHPLAYSRVWNSSTGGNNTVLVGTYVKINKRTGGNYHQHSISWKLFSSLLWFQFCKYSYFTFQSKNSELIMNTLRIIWKIFL